MTEDRRDEIDEVLSKYLPPKPASGGHESSETPVPAHEFDEVDGESSGLDADGSREGSEELTGGIFAWIKSNLLFIVPAVLLAWSLLTMIFG